MKVLVCSSEYYPFGGGIANVVLNVTKGLERLGVTCVVCSPSGPDVRLGSYKMIRKSGRLGLLHFWHQVKGYLDSQGDTYDCIWLHNPLFLQRVRARHCVATIHVTAYGQSVNYIYPLPMHIYRKASAILEKLSLRTLPSDTVFTAVSPQVRREVTELGVPAPQVRCVPNGVDTERFRPVADKAALRSKYRIPQNSTVLLSVGRLTPPKDPLTLIDVFSRLSRTVDRAALVFVGKGELLTKARHWAAHKGVHNVTFLGHIDHERDLPDLYACADYYVMVSRYEGQPLTLLEAIATGLPVVASDIPALRMVEEIQCGRVLDFEDRDGAAAGLAEYLRTDTTVHQRNAREYAVQHLDWTVIARQYLDTFERVVAHDSSAHCQERQ
jgi:glycosyltransferase involved in cell wall biosynthesis